MKDPLVCAQCAAQGPTCCRSAVGEEQFFFPLSVLEIGLITRHMPGLAADSFTASAPNSIDFIDKLSLMYPGFRAGLQKLFPPGENHYRLATAPDGSCIFLGRGGCQLDRSHRPLFCRLFPLWPDRRSEVRVFAWDRCLAQRHSSTADQLMTSLNADRETLLTLQGQLNFAWGIDSMTGPGHPLQGAGTEPEDRSPGKSACAVN